MPNSIDTVEILFVSFPFLSIALATALSIFTRTLQGSN